MYKKKQKTVMSVGRLLEIEHFHPDFITHPTDSSSFELNSWNPSVRQDKQRSEKALSHGSEMKKVKDSKPGRKWATVGQTSLFLALIFKSPSVCLCLCSPDPVRQRWNKKKASPSVQTPSGCSLSIYIEAVITEWLEVSPQSLLV